MDRKLLSRLIEFIEENEYYYDATRESDVCDYCDSEAGHLHKKDCECQKLLNDCK